MLFRENILGKWTPRSIFIDMEDNNINALERSPECGGLIETEQCCSYGESGAHAMHVGYEVSGWIDQIKEVIRREAEQCDLVTDFQFNNATAGSTAAGLTDKIGNFLSIDLCSKARTIAHSVMPPPSGLGYEVITSMNLVLSLEHKIDFNGLIDIWVDNERLYKLCQAQYGVKSPSHADINRLIAAQVSTLTQSRRFGGSNNKTFDEINANMIMYPRMKQFTNARIFPSPEHESLGQEERLE